jgi:hypothetical protein
MEMEENKEDSLSRNEGGQDRTDPEQTIGLIQNILDCRVSS